MAIMEKVQLVLDSVVKNTSDLLTARNNVNNLNKTYERFNQTLAMGNLKGQEGTIRGFGKELDSFNGVMGMTMPMWQTFNKTGEQFQTLGGQMANNIRNMTHGLKGFRMEMLGVMFFGQMMAQTLKQMLNPAAEVFGIFDLFQSMLQILFIPIMEELFPYFMIMFEWFTELPDPMKKVIGGFVVLGIVMFSALGIIGQFALGVGSLIQVFGGFVPMVNAIIKSVLVLTKILLPVGLIVWGVHMAFTNWGKDTPKALAGIGIAIIGIIALLVIMFGTFSTGGVLAIALLAAGAVWALGTYWDEITSFFADWFDKLYVDFYNWGGGLGRQMINGILAYIRATSPLLYSLLNKLGVGMSFGKFQEKKYRAGSRFRVGQASNFSFDKQADNALLPMFIPESGKKLTTQNTVPTVINNYDIKALDNKELLSMLNDRDRKLMEDLRRMTTI